MVDIVYDEAGFERDALGRIVRKTETILGATKVYEYRYDALRRLDQVKIDGVVEEEFTYDANGNRLTAFKQGVGTVTATYDDQDRLLTYGAWTFTYTANGELETKTNTANGDEWLFQCDALGNLVSVGLPNGDLVEYLVDGIGRRVGKQKNGLLTRQWIYRDTLKPVAELDGAGNLASVFVYGEQLTIPAYVVRDGSFYRVVSDHLGSPRYAVNVANAADVPFRASWSAFGEGLGTDADWMPFGFAGGQLDVDTTLIRFGARDFDPMVGRWTAKDPERWGGGLNLYAYADADPNNLIDALGLDPTFPECMQMAVDKGQRCLDECGDIINYLCYPPFDPAACRNKCRRDFRSDKNDRQDFIRRQPPNKPGPPFDPGPSPDNYKPDHMSPPGTRGKGSFFARGL